MKSIHHTSKIGLLSLFAASALAFAASAEPTQPTPKKTVAPQIAKNLRDAAGDVKVLVQINEYGFVTSAEIAESDNAALNQSALDAIHEWTFHPAQDAGRAVASKAIQPFSFNKGSIVLAAKKQGDSFPKAKTSVAPELTNDLKGITGEVVLMASIDSRGNVESVEIKTSTHDELEDASTAALAQWTFKPAIKDGQAVASKIIIPFHFEGTQAAKSVASRGADSKNVDKAPVALRQPTPELPAALVSERGEAKLRLSVDEHGYVAGVEVIESTNEALSVAAADAALRWKFKPAIKGGVPVASQVVQPFSFNGGLLMADLPVDRMPTVRSSKSPELPKALVGVQGYVKVRLNLDAQGNVINASSTRSSHDELVAPTLEAARDWKFKPAIREGEQVPSSVVVPFIFNSKS